MSIESKLIYSSDGLNNTTTNINHITSVSDSEWNDINKLINYNPTNLIKPAKQMGILSITDVSGVNIDANAMNQYYNTLFNGKNTATTITNNDQPLGERIFVPTGTKCNYNNKSVDKTYILDTMNYYKNADDSFDTTNTGLLYSAFGALQNINTDENLPIPGQTSNECVEVTIQKDGTPGNTITNYISKDEYDNLNCIIFPKNSSGIICKKYTGKNECDPCNQSVDKNPVIDSSVETFCNGKHGEFYKNQLDGNARNFGHKEHDYIYNPVIYNSIIYEIVDDDTIQKKKELVITNNVITHFYLCSITILGLFILYKLSQRK